MNLVLMAEKTFNQKNAEALAQIIIDGKSTPQMSVKILTKLLESETSEDFFRTMFEEDLSFGSCPKCGHENHWFVPEQELNKMGHVSFQHDERVKQFTSEKDCPEFAEACAKKKIFP